MKIGSNDSMAFTGIKFNTSKMDYDQIFMANRLEEAIKLKDLKESVFNNCVDVYVHPSSSNKSSIVAKFMDLYSGNYLRDTEGKIIQHELKSYTLKGYDALADKVLKTISRLAKGEIKRPKVSYTRLMNGKTTDMARVNPREAEKWAAQFKEDSEVIGNVKVAYEETFGRKLDEASKMAQNCDACEF